MSELSVNEIFLRLKNDSKKQWDYIIKLQQQILATEVFQFTLMANLREFIPPLHSKVVEGLDEFLEKTNVSGSKLDSSVFSEYFELLSDAQIAQLSEFHKNLSEFQGSEPPHADDLYQ